MTRNLSALEGKSLSTVTQREKIRVLGREKKKKIQSRHKKPKEKMTWGSKDKLPTSHLV